MFYNQETKGFYLSNPPEGSIEISPEEHHQLLEQQSLGYQIEVRDGVVVADQKPAVEAPDPLRNLSRSEFNGMLAAKGLDTVWVAMQTALAGEVGESAEGLRRQLAANLHKTYYNLLATLGLVTEFRDFAVTLNPDYALLLTDEAITSAWADTVALDL